MISIVIPTYKNRALLVANLKKNVEWFGDCEVIIVNDDPTESIAHDVSQFNNIILIENGQNLGFAAAVNKGVRTASNNYVMILNSDVILRDKSYSSLPAAFKQNSALFAISFAQIEKNGTVVGRNTLFWKNGFIQHSKVEKIVSAPNAWAEGGSMFIDKVKFDTLGGFSPLFSPFYWEDIDLSYRAWKAGYVISFLPKVLVVHHHESTIGKYFAKNKVKKIAYRHQLIFIWKNITDNKLLASHLVGLAKQMIRSFCYFDLAFIAGFAEATLRIPAILRVRAMEGKNAVLTDLEILAQFHENK